MQVDTTLLPVHGNDAVAILENDHKVIKDLLDELTAATGTDRAQTLEKLKGVLTIHNATEENLVYPAINKLAGSKLESQHLYHETAEADTVLFELDSMLKEQGEDADFVDTAGKFAEAVRHHIQEEEEKAFPRLREKVDDQHIASLASSVKEFRHSLHFEITP
jgi:hemerythrin superfamily protein